MSHRIEIDPGTGRAAFAASRQAAWHKLGTVIDADLTVEQGFDIAHLTGWDVSLVPLFAQVHEVMKPIEGHQAVTRINPFTGEREPIAGVGSVGSKYLAIQNEEVGEFVSQIVHDDVVLDAAGSLHGGRIAFATMRLGDDITIGGTADTVRPYLVASWGHDGSTPVRVQLVPTRVVCSNTLSMALGNRTAPKYTVRHSGSGVQGKAQEAREALDVAFTGLDEFSTIAAQWAEAEIANAEFTEVVADLFPMNHAVQTERQYNAAGRHRNDLSTLYYDAPTTDDIRGSAWGALNAWTEYVDWFSGHDVTSEKRAIAQATNPRLDQQRAYGASLMAEAFGLPVLN